MAYPPLVETTGRPVAQAEHTVYVGAQGVEVLTAVSGYLRSSSSRRS